MVQVVFVWVGEERRKVDPNPPTQIQGPVDVFDGSVWIWGLSENGIAGFARTASNSAFLLSASLNVV